MLKIQYLEQTLGLTIYMFRYIVMFIQVIGHIGPRPNTKTEQNRKTKQLQYNDGACAYTEYRIVRVQVYIITMLFPLLHLQCIY